MFSRLQNINWRPGQTLLVLFIVFLLIISPVPVYAAVCGENVPSDEGSLKTYIADCNAKLTQLSGQKQTLASAIGYLNTQIKLTQAKINATRAQLDKLNVEIVDLNGKIKSIDYSLDDLTKLFISRVRASYMYHNTYDTQIIAQCAGLSEILRGIEYTKKIRDHDRAILVSLEKSRLDISAQKNLKEIKQDEIEILKKKLDADKSALDSQIASKNKLLVDTKNDETRYQKLLSDAQRQLASFRRFVSNQGGAGILGNQTKCDSWGCYYNQRDGNWGNQLIGMSSEKMAEVGCLITSTAMIASHYGKSLTPGDIAASSSPFWGNTAYMSMSAWNVKGVNVVRTRIGSSTAKIDEELAAGRPVIVGIYSGPDHFLVIKAKDGNDYIMNDPFPENGGNLKFTSKYSLSSITTVDRVTVN